MERIKESFFSEKSAMILSIACGVIFLLTIGGFMFFGNWKFSWLLDESKIGQFGDFVGGVAGSLIAFVAVILYYVALREQQKDTQLNQAAFHLQIKALNQQIKEFEAQRVELEATRKIYEQQTKTMRNQQFDSNFYSLLNVFLATKNTLNSEGKDYFQTLTNEISDITEYNKDDAITITLIKTINSYVDIYLNNRGSLSLFFITIYRLLKMIDDCDHFTFEQKIFYSKVLRSQITKDELLILYYNYHSQFGKKVQSLILKYNFLKNLETTSKLEFRRIFKFKKESQFKIITFLDSIGNLLRKNIKIATNIENTEAIKVEEEEKNSGIIVGIYIDEIVEVKVFLDNSNEDVLELERDEFCRLIEYYLYDELFLNKFSFPEVTNIELSTTTKHDQLIYNYNIQFK